MATILIVDDLVIHRRSLAALLVNEGHQVEEAADGRAGLEAVLTHRPDLVITDVLMPVIDGYEFVRRLRLDPRTSGIPVLFYTAPYGEREARALARASGVPYVLTKPADAAEALKIVGQVLAGNMTIDVSAESEAATQAFDAEQLRLLGDQLSETVEDLRVANARLRALINIGLDFASRRDSDRRLRRLCMAALDLFGATHVTVGLLDLEDKRVRRVADYGADSTPWVVEGDVLTGILADTVERRRPVRGNMPSSDNEAFLVVPVASPAHVYGWICLVASERSAFTDEEESQLLALAGQVGRIYELEHEIAERQQAEHALKLSERLNYNLLEHLPHRIIVKDRGSVVRFCNKNYANDLGLSVDEVIGRNASDFYPPALAEAYNADDLEVMDTGESKTIEEPYESNGRKRWVHTVKVPYRDGDGHITGVLVVFEDITDRRLLAEQYQQAQKMEAIGQLAGGVAHDFNNLLTAILGYCELLVADLEPDDRRRTDIEEIQKAGLAAARLTRQLLAFSRKEIVEPTNLDLSAVVSDMRVMLGRLIREDVKIMVGLRADLGSVRADRGQVEQIILNLAINARDAMPGGGTLTIETAHVDLDDEYVRTHPFVKAGPYVALTVTDTGSGMTPEVQARIFEPFFTTKVPGRGTGLGLASVQGIIARAGGSVEVYSELGKGTAFKVYFRREQGDAADQLRPIVVNQFTGTETVLVVEDAVELRNLTNRLLTRQGYTVILAASADEAMQIVDAGTAFDVLLTDVVMPGLSGTDLAQHLREGRPGLKVIYMSGYTEDTIVQKGVLIPGIAFLPKPFTADTLGSKIRSVLDAA